MDEMHTKLWWAFILLCLTQAEAKCKFPKEWKGRWYQGGLGEVTIRSNTISTKGKCMETNSDGFYLVENRDRECFTCLLIMKQHMNILQYKESFCLDKDSIDKICSQIRVETPLYTLVREPHVPSPCPFHDAYYFDYNDNLYGFCDNGISYAKPCAGDYKFRFHFKHCVDIAMYHSNDMDFECVATWKDGSDMYLYGKFSGPSVLNRDESYRCFKYQAYGTEVYLAMSADTTCRGLRTPRDGPLVMEFKKDSYGFPPAACGIPEWLSLHTKWRDMDSKHLLHVHSNQKTIIISNRKRPDAKEHIKYELRCIETLEKNDTGKYLKMVSFSSHSCSSKHQCVIIQEKAPNLLEMKLGKLLEYEEAKRCKKSDFDETIVLIPDGLQGTNCPFAGRHRVLYGSADCPGDVLSGCNHTTQIDMKCNTDVEVLPHLECVSTWTKHNTTYVIARDPANKGGPAGCVSFEEKKNTIRFSSQCKYNAVPNILPTSLSITLDKIPLSCEEPEPPKPVEPVEPAQPVPKGEGQIVETESVEVHEEKGGVISSIDLVNAREGQYQHVDHNDQHETASEPGTKDSKHIPRVKERSKDKSKPEQPPESQAPQAANTASHGVVLTMNVALTLASILCIAAHIL